LKVSTNVKIAMQCFENFGGRNAPIAPWLRAWLYFSSLLWRGFYVACSSCAGVTATLPRSSVYVQATANSTNISTNLDYIWMVTVIRVALRKPLNT